MSNLQTSIKKEVSLTGVGLHTGKNVCLRFVPAPANTGYTFVRYDLDGSPEVEADVQWVIDTQRGTNLEKDGVRIHTSEHVLSALVGLEIDNCYIYLDAPEPPIIDGSSIHFVNALKSAGIHFEEERDEYVVWKSIILKTTKQEVK